jgi:hypothetical protein
MFLTVKIPALAIKLRDRSGYSEWTQEIELYLLSFHIQDIIGTPKLCRESTTETPHTILDLSSQWNKVYLYFS